MPAGSALNAASGGALRASRKKVMTTPIVPKIPSAVPVDGQTQILDEGRWQAWLSKGRAHDARSAQLQGRAVQWVAVFTLLAAAVTGPEVPPYPMIVRIIVSVAGIALMLKAARVGQYALGAVLGFVALLHNPIVPVFAFSGGFDRVLLLLSALPFFAWNGSRRQPKGDLSPKGPTIR
jgi:hypothetical protein